MEISLHSVDDSNVGRPSDDHRHVEVDDAGNEHEGGVVSRITVDPSRRFLAHVRPHPDRDVERRVMDPDVGSDSGCHADFESASAQFCHAQKSTECSPRKIKPPRLRQIVCVNHIKLPSWIFFSQVLTERRNGISTVGITYSMNDVTCYVISYCA